MKALTIQLEDAQFSRLLETAREYLSTGYDPDVARELEKLGRRDRNRRATDNLAGVAERASNWGDVVPDADEERLSAMTDADVVAEYLLTLAEQQG